MAKESTNGLTPADEALLRERLVEVERLHNSGPYLGGYERDKIRAVYNKLKNRLEPISPKELNAEAVTLIELFGAVLDEATIAMQRGRDAAVVDAVDEIIG